MLEADARGRALRRDAAFASISALLALALYAATLCRDVYWYDSAEYVTAALNLGVPHPPGYPLYTLIAHVFTWLPVSPALALNAMSACFAALAVALCYVSARAVGASRGAALCAGALLASGSGFWLNATIAEVYAPGLCCTLLVLLLLLQARVLDSQRHAYAAAALAGAGMGMHYSLASCGLGFAWLALAPSVAPRRPAAALQSWRASSAKRLQQVVAVLAVCAAAASLAYACVFSYVLWRASSDVVPNQAYPFSLARTAWLLSGGNYRLWFRAYEFGPRTLELVQLLATQVALAGLVSAVFGWRALWLRDRGLALALALCVAGNVGFFFGYRVDDLEAFLLPSVALLCVLAACGADALFAWVATRVPRLRRVPIATLTLLGVAGARIVLGYHERDLSAFSAARDYAQRLAVQLPYNAVILNYTTPEEWKRDTVFGMYFQNVLGIRRDVRVVAQADRQVLDRLLDEQRPTYLYAPVAHVAREYSLVADGELYRLVGKR